MGEQFFSYVVAPYSQKDPSDVVRRAMLLNSPPRLLMGTHRSSRTGSDGSGYEPGQEPGQEPESGRGRNELAISYSGIDISCANVVAQSIKYAENANGYIVRLVELSGAGAVADINFAPAKARFKVRMAPQEVKTYFIPFDGKHIAETYLTEDSM